jgi:hypothetical protein
MDGDAEKGDRSLQGEVTFSLVYFSGGAGQWHATRGLIFRVHL